MGRRKKRKWQPWTPEELALLVREWGAIGSRALLRKLQPHSWVAIHSKAKRLGLPLGIPQGCASLDALAKRAGMSREPFARILEESGVLIRNVYPGDRVPSYQRRYSQRRYAEVDEALEAFTRWLQKDREAA
jgi:hypothetical protein